MGDYINHSTCKSSMDNLSMDYSRKWIAEYCIGQFPDKVGDMMIRM
jgi:hypothetical protein